MYTVHGEKCYMCGKPVDLLSMEVDHIIPESLAEEPERLTKVVKDFGLSPDFDLQSYENWLPACRPCNGRKLARVFNPSTRVQLDLEIAATKAGQARALAEAGVHSKTISKAWNTIKRAHASGGLGESIEAAILEFAAEFKKSRLPELAGRPMNLTPLLQVLSEQNGIRIVRGPYGVGGGPSEPANSARCGVCGLSAWNGARCVACGALADD